MAFYDTTWYCNFGNGTSTGYYAVPVRPQNAAVVAGQLCRQFTTPSLFNERCYICVVAGTTANTTDAAWTVTRGAKVTDGTATWQECTGASAVNGDLINTANWTQAKAIGTPTLGAIIQRNNGASYQICSTAGTLGASEPAFSNTAGVTTTDGTTTWTSLGPVTNFTGGQAPAVRLASSTASPWFASGNTVYVGDNHAELQTTAASWTITSPLLCKIICHNHSGPYPPTASDIMTGAVYRCTAANVSMSMNWTGVIYFYGLTILGADGVVAAGNHAILIGANSGTLAVIFDRCSLQLGDTVGAGGIQFGQTGNSTWSDFTLNNTTIKFGSVSSTLNPQMALFVWQNSSPALASGSAVPATLFKTATSPTRFSVVLEALDLSSIPSILTTPSNPEQGTILVKDCKLNASVTVQATLNTGLIVQLSRSANGATPYVSSCYNYEGTETTETSIVRTGGFTDPTGQVQSRKIVTSANAQWLRPYKAEPYAVWNSVVGSSVTATVYGLAGIGALPNNDDIWLELQYLGSGASPLGSVATTTKANVWSSNAPGSSDGSSWPVVRTTLDGVPSAGIVMSNGNLTVQHGTTNSNTGVTSTAFFSGGKYYFEVTVQVSTSINTYAGIILVTATFPDVGGGTNCTAVGSGSSSLIYSNNVNTTKNLGSTGVGDVFGFAIDLTTRLAWIRRNNGSWNADGTANPATGVGGVTIAPGIFAPFVRFTNTGATDTFTANFGATAFANAAPSGFLSWDTGFIPFKLTTSFTPNLPGAITARIRAAKPSTVFYIDPKLTVS